MYSGTTCRPFTGRRIGARQKIDGLARDSLQRLLVSRAAFPSKRLILRFEGLKGPDAIKRKSPAKNGPWHFYARFDDQDKRLIATIESHYAQLVSALKRRDEVRAAF